MIGNATTLSKCLSSTCSVMTCLYYRSKNSRGTLRVSSLPPPACHPYPPALIQTLPTPARPQMRENPPLLQEVMEGWSRPSCNGSRDVLESKRDFSGHWEFSFNWDWTYLGLPVYSKHCLILGSSRYGVAVQDFGKSWTSGLAFLAVIKSIDPSLVDMRRALLRAPRENIEEAFRKAHYSLGIPRLLEPEGKYQCWLIYSGPKMYRCISIN